MAEPFDEYIDQFHLAAGIYGVSLNFARSSPKPQAPGTIPAGHEVGAIRMSFEHFKLMTFLMKRQVAEIESQLGIDIPVSRIVMNNLKIAPEDWDGFWRK